LKIFQARQQRQEQWNRERESVMADAQEAARRQVVEAKLALQTQADATRHTMEDSIEELASEILRAILPKERATVGRVS
jgi:regulator of PEP synthase PpsR (kinase-PPPase family)